MIKISDFPAEAYNEIIKAAKRSLIMVGVTANVHLNYKESRGTEYLELKTDDFNTTPVIYENVRISGSAQLVKIAGLEGVLDLTFSLDYWFDTFGGGHNGTSLGELKFRVFEERKEVRFVGFLIR